MSESDSAAGTHEVGGGRRRRHRSFDAARARVRVAGALIAVVRWIGTLAAALLALHVVLTLGGANPDNSIARFVADWAQPLALGFSDLFVPQDPQLAILLNYGIAALFWLVATSIAVRILRLIAR
ncbi:hypothetical protein A8924_0671 [Saccharopolyspora erythraea NRRL 2338]|uniref:Uncharacterized protein n=2 Tax=Saccharopolyspora erythraea TaxID=1836 RepID=A4F6F1_SACEN|nr:hypothetical protein [Saccharopolyspora erythraea]EQD88084.1 hypothetical protein N599_01345 [Saccharopolyspora erythraea D]PFG93430.1 hypothetical protein A8924_0671 [Saccharopolyspora erythraea NRRL 2338]QRK90303.1 hypothetical protein JQX30_01865 [Saccharopolyspora erythraea]CAL99625.1 hypothetical protein SACE_0276 [Saccharopolyspora erythraea NRRL 2338]